MTILGRGDLSPRRRARRRGVAALAVAGLAALGAGGWFGWHTWHRPGPTRAAVKVCVTPTAAPEPVAPGDVTVAVLNATDRAGLAHSVAAALKARGFHVGRVGNTTASVSGTASVTYPPGAEGAARTVAEQVAGATLVAGTSPRGSVVLALGPSFRALASTQAAAAARAHDEQAASPRPAVCSAS